MQTNRTPSRHWNINHFRRRHSGHPKKTSDRGEERGEISE